MSDNQNDNDVQIQKAGVAQLLALRAPSDKSLIMIVCLFVIMLIIKNFVNDYGSISKIIIYALRII